MLVKKAPNQVKIDQDLTKMVSITLEWLWMVSDRFSIFRQNPQVRTGNNFQLLNYHGACELSIKKTPKTSSRWWILLWKDYGWFLIELLIFDFFVKFHRSGPVIIFSFWTIMEHVNYASKKLLIKPGLHQDGEYYSGRIMDGFW